MGGRRGRLISSKSRQEAVKLIDEACRAGARRSRACELLGISPRTLRRWRQPDGLTDKRKGSQRTVANRYSPSERAAILSLVNSAPYSDLAPCKIVPMLADKGKYVSSESTIYRLLREAKQLAHRTRSQPARHNRPKTYIATASNQVWSWDITYLPSVIRGWFYYLYMVLDIYSRKVVGFGVHERQSSGLGAKLIKQACLDEGISRKQVTLHSDNGKPMKGSTMLSMLQSLGVTPSFSRPSVSDDNPFSEALFRTVKYHPNFPVTKRFKTISEARQWSCQFVEWYNDQHLHSGLKFVTPAQRHSGEDRLILAKRHEVYQQAKAAQPARWARETRNWKLPAYVALNPERDKSPQSSQACA